MLPIGADPNRESLKWNKLYTSIRGLLLKCPMTVVDGENAEVGDKVTIEILPLKNAESMVVFGYVTNVGVKIDEDSKLYFKKRKENTNE